MNVFYEELPTSLTIGDRSYRIITDFREWIRFSDMIKSDIPTEIKNEFISEMFLDQINLEDMFDEVINKMVDFLSMGPIQLPARAGGGRSSTKGKQTLSYEYDAPYLISAYIEYYGINLLNVEYLHWWMFRMLLDGLPDDCHIKQRIFYRSVDLSDIKDKEERRRILRIKKSIELPESGYVSDGDIGNAF